MSNKELEEKVERLERVVMTLATWLVREIGSASVNQLGAMLKERESE